MNRFFAVLLVMIGSGVALMAAPSAPEIDPASGAGALALLSGVLLVVRGRRK